MRRRDKSTCQMCGSTKLINVHHIKRHSDAPSLRFSVNNGICLCKVCHGRVTGREEVFAPMLIKKVYFNTHGVILRDDDMLSPSPNLEKEEDNEVG